MRDTDWRTHTPPSWTPALVVTLLLQLIAFTFWAGRLSASVADLQTAVHDLQVQLHQHVSTR